MATAAANGGKATRGGRDLPVELIRAGGPALQAKVHGILRDSCRQFAIPPRLKNPALAFLHKPGKPRDVIKKSLRPIGVLSHAGNALGGVVHQWTGLKLSLFMTFILFTGTLAVLSAEIDWVLQPSLRVAPSTVEGPVACARKSRRHAAAAPCAPPRRHGAPCAGKGSLRKRRPRGTKSLCVHVC